MCRIRKDMEGRYCSILLQGMPVAEIKVKKVEEDFVIGEYDDNTDICINHAMVLAYWPDKAKDLQARKREEKRRAKKLVD